MQSLSLSQLKSAAFDVRPAPVLRPFGGSFLVADPSLLLPEETPDGKWHLFFHTMFGVWEAVSDDGVAFTKKKKLLSQAMRPNINFVDGRYVLFYERTRPLMLNGLNFVGAAKWHSEIYAIESRDLKSWSAPQPVLRHTKDFEESPRGVSLSNPFLLRVGDVNRLYYSCGLTYIKDCHRLKDGDGHFFLLYKLLSVFIVSFCFDHLLYGGRSKDTYPFFSLLYIPFKVVLPGIKAGDICGFGILHHYQKSIVIAVAVKLAHAGEVFLELF